MQDHRIEQFILSPLHTVLVISYEMLLRCLEQASFKLSCTTNKMTDIISLIIFYSGFVFVFAGTES